MSLVLYYYQIMFFFFIAILMKRILLTLRVRITNCGVDEYFTQHLVRPWLDHMQLLFIRKKTIETTNALIRIL